MASQKSIKLNVRFTHKTEQFSIKRRFFGSVDVKGYLKHAAWKNSDLLKKIFWSKDLSLSQANMNWLDCLFNW